MVVESRGDRAASDDRSFPNDPTPGRAAPPAEWDVAGAHKRLTLRGHRGRVLSVAFSPDGRMLASGGADNAVKLWNVGAAAPDGQ